MHKKFFCMVKENYDIEIISAEIMYDHTYSKTYLLLSQTNKYVLKEIGSDYYSLESEGAITEYLSENGVLVSKLFRAKNGNFSIFNGENSYSLQKFIEGKQFALNTAPHWFMKKSAQTLGQIQNVLKNYKNVPQKGFTQNFFSEEKYINGERYISQRIKQAEEENNPLLVVALNERLRHIKKVSRFKFDCDKLTYVVTHGDFYINQVIVKDKELITIDWTNPGYIPACLEVLMSYVYAAPECKTGVINASRFSWYLNEYIKCAKISLNSYDIKIMPYFLYHYCIFCSFTPPYDNLSKDYFEIANHTDTLANWLYANVEMFSAELLNEYQKTNGGFEND